MYGRPNIIKALKTLICFVLAFALTVICGATVASADDSQSQINTTLSGYSKIDEVDGYALFADMDTGNFCLADKTGHSWFSSPQDISEDPYSKSSTKTVLRSLLSITYVNKQEVVGTAKEYTVNSYAAVKAGTVEVSSHDGVVRVVYTFEEQKFVVPVEYKLEKNHISVSIDIGGIKEGKTFKILEITLLPGFCVGSWQQEGYIFIPDGCGALINYNSGYEDKYEEMVYGDELAIEKELNSTVKQTIRLPVFGTVSSGQALMGVITEGDGAASITAASSNKTNGYNTVSASFIMRSLTPKAMLTKSYAKQYAYRMSDTDKNLKSFTVRYYPHTGEDADYNGFARTYRNYLINEKGLKKSESKPAFNINILGAVDVKANFMGFTYYKPTPLTSFSQAVDMLEDLDSAGIKELSLSYQGWQNDGLVNEKISGKAKAMQILGGKKGLEKLISYTKESGIPLFTDVDLINYNGGSNKNSAKTAFNEVAKQYSYMYSVYAPRLDTKTGKLLTPNKITDIADKYLKAYKKIDNKNISLSTLTNTLYSDLGEKNLCVRSSVPHIIGNILDKYSDSGLSLAGDSANAYAVPYMNKILNAPTTCSGFLMESEEIPFYQLVLHGYVSLTMPSQERADSPIDNYLTAIETGSELLWTGIAEDASELSDTTSDKYYSTTYTLWLEDAAQKYEEYMPLISRIGNSVIVSHKMIADDVTQTVFDCGVTVTVNHSENPYVFGDVEIAAKDFAVD